MDSSHKTKNCLNCGHPLAEHDNFCPNCGQENSDYKLTAWELLVEFVRNYIDLDSRFGRSILPFLFKPGYLTNAFVDGKRKKYVHPVRFYLITSLLFFIVLSFALNLENAKWLPKEPDIETKLRQEYNADSSYFSLTDLVDMHIADGILSKEEGTAMLGRMNKKDKLRLLSIKLDQDTSKLQNDELLGTTYQYNSDKFYYIWIRQDSITADALLDSMRASKKGVVNRYLAEKFIKLGSNDPNMIFVEMIENIPTMIFLLIPIFAFYLKMLYITSKRLYLEHLILGFHLHTFIYFLLACSILWAKSIGSGWLFYTLIPLLIIIYTIIMFSKVYKQGFFKTFFKLGVLSIVYFFTITFFSVFEAIISFLIF